MSDQTSDPMLPAVIRLPGGKQVFDGALRASEHRRMHIEILHEETHGLLELAAGQRDRSGRLLITTRESADHFLPGGGAGEPDWLERACSLATRHHAAGRELFVSPSERSTAAATSAHVRSTRWLWVDVDHPERLPALYAFFGDPAPGLPDGRQPHLLIESAGETAPGEDGRPFGGVHALYRLADPLPAVTATAADGKRAANPRVLAGPDAPRVYADPSNGEVLEAPVTVIEEIERAHLRLIYALGYRFDDAGRQVPTVADPVCRDRSRVLRLAGSRHGASGRFARIVWADRARPPYTVEQLVGDLPDPQDREPSTSAAYGGATFYDGPDPYMRIPIIEVYEALTGQPGSSTHKVRCPHRDHPDEHPSCDLKDTVFRCRSCEAGGGVYQMASAVLGGPTENLRGEDFKRAHAFVVERLGQR